jgi:hypothetical protein
VSKIHRTNPRTQPRTRIIQTQMQMRCIRHWTPRGLAGRRVGSYAS